MSMISDVENTPSYRNDPDYAGIIEKFEYKNGVYFSLRPQECPDTCPNASSKSCPSRMKQFNYKNGFYIDYDDSAVEGKRFKIFYKSIKAVTVSMSESETDYGLGYGLRRTQGVENFIKPL